MYTLLDIASPHECLSYMSRDEDEDDHDRFAASIQRLVVEEAVKFCTDPTFVEAAELAKSLAY